MCLSGSLEGVNVVKACDRHIVVVGGEVRRGVVISTAPVAIYRPPSDSVLFSHQMAVNRSLAYHNSVLVAHGLSEAVRVPDIDQLRLDLSDLVELVGG